jgi:replicative DNA helicase
MSSSIIADLDANYQAGPMPPHDLQAEQSVLGGMMLSREAIAEVTEVIDVGDFYRPAHSAIYEAILHLYANGDPTEPIALSAELERRGDLGRVGGAPYLHTLIATIPTAANAAYYADMVAEKAIARRMTEAGIRITQLGYSGADGSDEITEMIDRAQSELDTIADRRLNGGAGYALLADLRVDELSFLDDLQAGRVDPGLPTGFLDVDELLGGLKPGQFVVVAGRPGSGKSTLAVDIARNTSIRNGKSAAIFSLEMSRSELWRRIIAAEARIRHRDLETPGQLTASDYDRIAKALEKIEAGGPLAIDDTPNMTMTQIRAKAKRVKAKHGLDLIVIDYLQLMTSGRKVESRQVEVSEFSRQSKILAKELQVPVVALSQLNRGPEQRVDKRPMLSDLRESGSLEQDCDIAILVHRPDMYDRDDPRAGEADLIIAKNRSGPTSVVTLAHRLHLCSFADLAQP